MVICDPLLLLLCDGERLFSAKAGRGLTFFQGPKDPDLDGIPANAICLSLYSWRRKNIMQSLKQHDENEESMTDSARARSLESWVAALFLAFFLIFNILTATSYPYPSGDECMFAEPAISYLHGHGFVIRFSEMVTMYSFLLVPWMKLFGTSLRSVRAFDVTVMTAAFFVLWSAVKRLEVLGRASFRLLLLVLLATEFALIFAYRSGRYDSLGALLMASVLWAMGIKEKRNRLFCLFAVCLFFPWAGLQFLPMVLTAGLALLLVFRWRFFAEIAVSFLATGVGGMIFLALLAASGRLSSFLAFVHSQRHSLILWGKNNSFVQHGVTPKDFSLPFIIAAAVVLFFSFGGEKRSAQRSILACALLYSTLLSGLLLLSAKFPTYYCYMITIPLAVSICAGLSLCKPGKLRNVVLLFCALSSLVGVGLNVAAYAGDRQDRDYSRVESFISQVVRPDDIAYADLAGYLATRQRAQDVYLPVAHDTLDGMSPQQRDSVTVLIVSPQTAENIKQCIGGNWQETGQKLVPTGHSIFGNKKMGFLTFEPNNLMVFRRK
jgi:hypothetical protein